MNFIKNVSGFFSAAGEWLANELNNLLAVILQLLPESPFKVTLSPELRNILGYVNWIIPFGRIVATMAVWALAIGVFYTYKVILRWAKAI